MPILIPDATYQFNWAWGTRYCTPVRPSICESEDESSCEYSMFFSMGGVFISAFSPQHCNSPFGLPVFSLVRRFGQGGVVPFHHRGSRYHLNLLHREGEIPWLNWIASQRPGHVQLTDFHLIYLVPAFLVQVFCLA